MISSRSAVCRPPPALCVRSMSSRRSSPLPSGPPRRTRSRAGITDDNSRLLMLSPSKCRLPLVDACQAGAGAHEQFLAAAAKAGQPITSPACTVSEIGCISRRRSCATSLSAMKNGRADLIMFGRLCASSSSPNIIVTKPLFGLGDDGAGADSRRCAGMSISPTMSPAAQDDHFITEVDHIFELVRDQQDDHAFVAAPACAARQTEDDPSARPICRWSVHQGSASRRPSASRRMISNCCRCAIKRLSIG